MDALWLIPGFLSLAGLALLYLDRHRPPMPTKPPTSMVLPNTYKRYVGEPGPQRLLAFNGHQHSRLSRQQLTTTQWLDEQTVGLPEYLVGDPKEWEAS